MSVQRGAAQRQHKRRPNVCNCFKTVRPDSGRPKLWKCLKKPFGPDSRRPNLCNCFKNPSDPTQGGQNCVTVTKNKKTHNFQRSLASGACRKAQEAGCGQTPLENCFYFLGQLHNFGLPELGLKGFWDSYTTLASLSWVCPPTQTQRQVHKPRGPTHLAFLSDLGASPHLFDLS